MRNVFLILCTVTLALASCSSNDGPSYPDATVEQMLGDYKGKMTVNKEAEKEVIVKVGKKIEMPALPVEAIVKAMVAAENQEAALASVKNVAYAIDYKATILGHQISLELNPVNLKFNVLVKEKEETIEVTFDKKAPGMFDGSNNSLTFYLKATGATITGNEAAKLETPVEYLLLPTKKTIVAVTVKDVEGTYPGKLIATQGEKKVENDLTATAKENVLTMAAFPIKEVVMAVVKDEAKADEIIKEMKPVDYKLAYEPVLAKDKSKIELTFKPAPLTFKIKVDEKEKEVSVDMKLENKGVYVVKDKTLTFGMTADKVTVDKEALEDFKAVVYSFPAVVKK